MTVSLEVGGMDFYGWEKVEVKRCLDYLAGSFELSISGDYQDQFPIKRGSAIRVKIDGVAVLTGWVDKIAVEYDSGQHILNISGRDKTSDIVDSTIDGQFSFNAPVSLVGIAFAMLGYYKIGGIGIIDKTGGIDPFSAGEVVSAHLGCTVFDAIETYCRLRQVFMTTNGDGNIVFFEAGQAADSGVKLAHLEAGTTGSNILRSSISFDDSDRFNRYVVWSQGNVSAIGDIDLEGGDEEEDGGDSDSTSIATRQASATDSGVRTSRIYNFTAEHSVGGKVGNHGKSKRLKKGSTEDIYDRATWEANIRRARSLEYKVLVQGHTKTGMADPWQVFETVPVQDDFANVNAVLLIKEVNFKLDLGGGTVTELTLVNQDAYTLKAEEDEREAEANKVGTKFAPEGIDLSH